jgi:hypothetical protein
MRIGVAMTVLWLGLGAPGCNAAGPDGGGRQAAPPGQAAQAAPGAATPLDGWHRAIDRTTGAKLLLPADGYHLQGEHYQPGLPPQKMTDRLSVVGPKGSALEVQVWHNVEGLELDAWFERYLGSLRAADSTPARGSATEQRVPAIFLEFPKSPQSTRQRMAVFALGERVYRFVCFDADDESAALLFERALAGFAVEVTP